MDPIKTIQAIREHTLAVFMHLTASEYVAAQDEASNLAEAITSLDGWMKRGGFLPEGVTHPLGTAGERADIVRRAESLTARYDAGRSVGSRNFARAVNKIIRVF